MSAYAVLTAKNPAQHAVPLVKRLYEMHHENSQGYTGHCQWLSLSCSWHVATQQVALIKRAGQVYTCLNMISLSNQPKHCSSHIRSGSQQWKYAICQTLAGIKHCRCVTKSACSTSVAQGMHMICSCCHAGGVASTCKAAAVQQC